MVLYLLFLFFFAVSFVHGLSFEQARRARVTLLDRGLLDAFVMRWSGLLCWFKEGQLIDKGIKGNFARILRSVLLTMPQYF